MLAVTQGLPSVAECVAAAMRPENITTQVLDDRSRWVTVNPDELEEPR